jgi:hypothetical protein
MRATQVCGNSGQRRIRAGLVATLASLASVLSFSGPAFAADGPEVLSVSVMQTDGTFTPGTFPLAFDATAGPGNDTGAQDSVVRTNDLLQYDIEVSVNPDGNDATTDPSTAENVTIEFDLPLVLRSNRRPSP